MRFRLALAGILVLLGSRPALAQSAPGHGTAGEMTIAVPEVDAHSGPGLAFNITNRLRQGDRVIVVQDAKTQPGWVAIKAPPGSFSWIEAKHVLRRPDNQIAAVIGDAPAPVRPGSAFTTKAPDRESTRVNPGALVVIVGREVQTDAGVWLPIEPPPQDVRYILQEALRSAPAVAAVSNPPPAPPVANTTATAIIAQADQAFASGQLEQAKQLYRQALERATSYDQRVYCQNRLTSLNSGPSGGQWTSGNLSGQPTSLTRPNATPPAAPLTQQPQWSVWGQLRQTAFQKDGLPMYVLENRQGTPLLYVSTQPGFSLRDYIGKTVSLYGPITYRSDEYMRMHYMTASHVATLPSQ
jgi:hypothetical protein